MIIRFQGRNNVPIHQINRLDESSHIGKNAALTRCESSSLTE
jgi:hypothetical protein